VGIEPIGKKSDCSYPFRDLEKKKEEKEEREERAKY